MVGWGPGRVGGDSVFKLVPGEVGVYPHVENKGGSTLLLVHEGVSGLERCCCRILFVFLYGGAPYHGRLLCGYSV